MSDELERLVDAAINKQWADYYASRAVRLEEDRHRLYGLKIQKTYQEYYNEFLEKLKAK